MKKVLVASLVLIVGLISQSKLNAQASFAELENNKVMYPSPTAATLGKYGEYPVSLYNGSVNIGQDIVTVKSGHLALNVSLSYNASGNKPSDIPGWVGLGFSLNAGGVITRIIKDLPDDLPGGFYTSNTSVQYLWNNYPNSDFLGGYFDGTNDPQSDEYLFNFCGKTGKFIFDWDRNIHFTQKVPFKVEVSGGSGGFGGFVVTTDDGTIYKFDLAEHSQVTAMSVNPPITSWYLTKIKNLSGDSIVLKYTEPAGKYRYKQYSTRKEVNGSISGAQLVTSPTINLNTSTDEVVYLDEIDFNTGKLIFNKSKRLDPYFVPAGINPSYAEEKKLDLIALKDNNNHLIKQWKFDYFENSTERLKLKDLIAQASDQTDVQKYSFEYNSLKLPISQPGPNFSNPYLSNDVDYWGYYNAISNGDNRIPEMYVSEYDQYVGSANRSINPAAVKAEILSKINYPTGGYTSFEFESNDYSSQGASFAAAQNPMTQSNTPPEYYELNYHRDDGGFDIDPTTVSFTLTEPTHVHIKYSCGADGPLHEWANPATTYEYDLQMAVGTHTLSAVFQTDLLLSPSSADITAAHCYATVYKIGQLVPINAKAGPGLRIKSISTNDGTSTTTRSFEYKIENSSTISSGVLSVFPAFYAPLQAFAANMQGLYLTSEPINDIGDGAPVGYSRVVERFQDNSSIVHNYTTYDNYPDDEMPFLNGYSSSLLAHMSSNNFHRGLETNTRYYDANGILQKEITNSYDILPGSLTDVQSIDVKPTVGIITSPGGGVNNVNATVTSIYYVHSCFLYNSSKTEITYDKNGQNAITTFINKYYDNLTHLQPTRIETAGSDGSVLTTATSYPDDFAPGVPFIDYMQANHLTSYPIEQVAYKQKGGVNNIVSGNIITYKTVGAGLPDQLLKLETASPIPQASFKFSNRLTGVLPPSSQRSQYSADTHYQPALTYTQYDNSGNPLESIARNGIKTSYLWGYKQEYPVAKIVGTDYSTASGRITNPSILVNPSSDGDLRTELNKLRAIPSAFATTYTFAPLIGVTSETDPQGRTSYYEYDGFQRLNLIRDQDQNILKKYCYNYAGQPEACGFYASATINGYYYSQSCPSGEDPVAYYVTVPQGMFVSHIDQQAANQLAQQYAQSQADQHGSCVIPNVSLYYDNEAGAHFTIHLHNVASGQDYWIDADPHGDGTFDVPPGTYDIIMSPVNPGGYFNYSVGCGYWDAGPSITFYSVEVSSSCNTISIN